MPKKLKKNRKKKGFTLIELVIVLAVLAIIAMIAIPNFTKVRNKALVDGDKRSAEQIEKITLMAIANGDITLNSENQTFILPEDPIDGTEDLFRDINAPQVPGTGEGGYTVIIGPDGRVGVGYTTPPNGFNGAKQGLAGTLAGHDDLTPDE